jgi:hypothetical protein
MYYENNILMCKIIIDYSLIIANISESGKSDIKIMLNHKVGHEKNVKIVFIKKSKEAATIIKKIEIVGIEGE